MFKGKVVQVGISEMVVSSDIEEILITYSLGSCVGVTLYDPVKRVGGLIHCMLPVSIKDPMKAKEKPFMFVDTGVILLVQKVLEAGAVKNNLICKVAGAGHPMDDNGLFRIGEKNYAILRKILWKNDILIKGELIGDKTAKTLILEMGTGRTVVKINGEEIEI